MSRNLGRRHCAFCDGHVVTTEEPRLITKDDAGTYFPEFAGMLVSNAACVDCEAPYLAWLDGTHRESGVVGWGWDYPRHVWVDGNLVPSDLSHRQSFNDEPGPADYPKYQIVRVRQPWPTCAECGGPLTAHDGRCDRVYSHKAGVGT
jgi:prepilin-type processing-associated H-X9-DG protein